MKLNFTYKTDRNRASIGRSIRFWKGTALCLVAGLLQTVTAHAYNPSSINWNPPGDPYGSGDPGNAGISIPSPYTQGDFTITYNGYAEEDSHTLVFGTHWSGKVGVNFSRVTQGPDNTQITISRTDGSEFWLNTFKIDLHSTSTKTLNFQGFRDGSPTSDPIAIDGLTTGSNTIQFSDPAFGNIDEVRITAATAIRGFLRPTYYHLTPLSGNEGDTIEPGDIAIIAASSVYSDMAFIALEDLPGDQYIYFTTVGWDSVSGDWLGGTPALVSAGYIANGYFWKTPSAGVSKGTIVRYLGSIGERSDQWITFNLNGDTWFLQDQILVFSRASADAAEPNFIYAANFSDGDQDASGFQTTFGTEDDFRTGVPTGLTAAASGEAGSAFGLAPVNGYDVALKTGVLADDMTRAEILQAIHTPSNWEVYDDGAYAGFNLDGRYPASITIAAAAGIYDLAGNALTGTPYTSGETYIYDPNDAPTDILISNNSVRQSDGSDAYVGSLTAIDADGSDTHTYALVAGDGDTDNGLFYIAVNSLVANDASLMAGGSYSVRIRATDNDNAEFEKVFTVEVADDISPVITSAITASGTYDSAFSYTITASGEAVNFSATGLPTGLSLNTASGEITGSPTQTGVFQASLLAFDAASNFDQKTLEITVAKASASIVLANLEPVYDGTSKAVSASTTPEGLTVNLTYDGESTAPINAGSYAVAATIVDDNYTGTESGSLVIGKAALVADADNASRTYGSANPAWSGTLTGAVAGDNLSVSFSSATTTASPAGTYDIVPEVNDPDNKLGNYNVTLNNGILTVGKATVIATAEDKSRTYGSANPELTIGYSGFVNGETVDLLDEVPSVSTEADAGAAVGDYPITLSGGSDANYEFSLVNGTLSISAAELTATADDASRSYGESNPAFTGTLTGVVNNDNLSLTFSTSADESSPVGTYDIVPAVNDPDNKLGNYTLTVNNGTLTVAGDDAPVLTLGGGDRYYTMGDAPLLVALAAGVTDGGSADFAGGQLTVSFVEPLIDESSDRLELVADEDPQTGLSLMNGQTLIGAVAIGIYSGGEGAADPFTVSFNSSATADNVQALLRRLAFSTTNNLSARTVRVSLTDGDGGVAEPVDLSVQINRRPVPAPDLFAMATNTVLTVSLSSLVANDKDPDGDGFSLMTVDAFSKQGGAVALNGENIEFTPSLDYAGADVIEYLVRDSRGGEAIGRIRLKVLSEGKLALLPVRDEQGEPTDEVKLYMGSSQPGRIFDIEASNDLNTWTYIGQGTVTEDGLVEFLDNAPRTQPYRFYRLLAP